MSKHTKKVHGKLNFLIVAVVIMSGVMAFLLIQNGVIDFNPSELSGSGNKAIKGVSKAVKYDNRSEISVSLDGEEMQEFLNNQDFQKINWYLNKLRDGDSSNELYDPNSNYYFDNLGDDRGPVWFWLSTAFESSTTTKGNKAMVRKFYASSNQYEKDKYYWVMPIRRFNY